MFFIRCATGYNTFSHYNIFDADIAVNKNVFNMLNKKSKKIK